MKTKLLTLLAILSIALFSGCSKDEDSFNYPTSDLLGTWDATHIRFDTTSNWYDLSLPAYTNYQMAIRFDSDGSYYGSGALGYGSGTYTMSGNTITTYIDGDKYGIYEIIS